MSVKIPEVKWHKELKPASDTQFLEIIETMERSGVPFCIHKRAAAANNVVTPMRVKVTTDE